MKYLPLFTLELNHPYWRNNRCVDFQIEPSQETWRFLNNQRCVLKAFPNGVRVLAAVTDAGESLIPLETGSRFLFRLRLQNRDFPLYTDLTDFAGVLAPVYSNAGLDSASGTVNLALRSRLRQVTETFPVRRPSREDAYTLGGRPLPNLDADDFVVEGLGAVSRPSRYLPTSKVIVLDTSSALVDSSFRVGFPSAFPTQPGILADVEIRVDASPPAITAGPGTFRVVFKAREAHWRYFLVTDRKDADFQIEDKSENPILFGTEHRVDLTNEPGGRDPVARHLAERYPDLKRYHFTSDAPVACRQAARRGVQLTMDGDPVAVALPSPSFRNFAQQEVDDGGSRRREDLLYHVLKFLGS